MVEAASTTPSCQPIEGARELSSAIHRYPHMYPQTAVVPSHTMVSERRALLELCRHLLRRGPRLDVAPRQAIQKNHVQGASRRETNAFSP